MGNWFGEHWKNDWKDINDMRVRAGGTVLGLLWMFVFSGAIWGVWQSPGGSIQYFLSVGVAIAFGIILILALFIPRVAWNLILSVGAVLVPLREKLDVSEVGQQTQTVMPTETVPTRGSDEQPLPAQVRRIIKKVGKLLVSWLPDNGTPTDVRYHCSECSSHPEVSVKLLRPERPGIRIATGSRSYPVGAICPRCRNLLGQWSSWAEFHRTMNGAFSD